jgi:hypothetical protein
VKKRLSEDAQAEVSETQSIAVKALQEIRTIHWSLEATINIILESGRDGYMEAAQIIRPAVERLGAVIEENKFAE